VKRWLALTLIGAALIVAAAFAAGFLLYQRGLLHLNNPDRSSYPVRGLDVSEHQGIIDWEHLVEVSNIRFAFIKASEGTKTRDHLFKRNWTLARGRVARGAYHFFTFCGSGGAQARNFLSVLPRSAELPPAVDVEFSGNCRSWTSLAEVRRQLATFLSLVRRKSGRTPLIYVTKESYGRIIKGRFTEYSLWVREVVFTASKQAYPSLRFWQWTGKGRPAGVAGFTDLDVFVGTERDFETYARQVPLDL
jgi:lysozyme